MNTRDWQKDLEPIMRKAGSILLSFWGTPLERFVKPEHGFATQADLASERFLIDALKNLMPKASFYAEEQGKFGPESSDYCWVIDPLDGTTNFAHMIPYFCVSVALTYHDEPIVAAIYQPLTDEWFYAQKNGGAWLNGEKISVSGIEKLSDALIASALPYGLRHKQQAFEVVEHIIPQIYGVRHYGAAALDCAYVAAGRFDGVLFEDLAWWDVAAGALLIMEAGGLVTDFSGKILRPDYASCVAGSPRIQKELRRLLERRFQKE